MSERDRLVALLSVPIYPLESADPADVVADYLLDNDVRPAVHAHWEERDDVNGDTYYRCSYCSEDLVTIDGATPTENGMNYCPYCGAKMDEEAKRNGKAQEV